MGVLHAAEITFVHKYSPFMVAVVHNSFLSSNKIGGPLF